MNAEVIAEALGGRRTGAGWMARCPAHEDREPSLAISERGGMVLVHCHAGCEQRDVIAALRSRGFWATPIRPEVRARIPARAHSDAPDRLFDQRRREKALALWNATQPACGTLVERYLRSRGLSIPPSRRIRFHPSLRHASGETFPAMVALVTRGIDDLPLGVHRTFLAADGWGKAPVSPQKMMLGPCRGGVVRLGQTDQSVMIGEGIETCISAMQATGRPAWAALSASGMRALDLPVDIEDVVVLADGDEPGEAAANVCARRWQSAKRRIRVARPPAGMDFNDLLMIEALPAPGGPP